MRCACETLVTTGTVFVTGEIRTQAYVDVQSIARDVVCSIGYDRAKYGFDGNTCAVMSSIHEQSSDIAQGVDESFEAQRDEAAAADPYETVGAGDQGMMFGYACNETSTLMPMPIYLAHRLSERLTEVRKNGTLELSAPRRQDPGHRCATSTERPQRLRRWSCPPSTPRTSSRTPLREAVIEHGHPPGRSRPKGWRSPTTARST